MRYFEIYSKALFKDEYNFVGVYREDSQIYQKSKELEQCIVKETDPHLISDCCGAEPRIIKQDTSTLDHKICPDCHEHCTYIPSQIPDL